MTSAEHWKQYLLDCAQRLENGEYLDDSDAIKLRECAAYFEGFSVPYHYLAPETCRCEHPLVRCDDRGCRCTQCGGLA